ncbi:hypothetical protein SGRA_1192 [Saprospira grandis str. Lewin]|uniref:Uncharacterized protein n=1 Tax=Saprospira grandis (strain Lewin) TaxID=984262 RepID=H6L4K3_SAPGL|nr:hypothetical protein SGRA_1192 [Saprospira grandis str. Lewin]
MGPKSYSCSLKAAANLLGHHFSRRRSLKAPALLEMGASIRFSGLAAFKLQLSCPDILIQQKQKIDGK